VKILENAGIYSNAFEELPHNVAVWFLDRVQGFTGKKND
jgi:hypothetical protein